MIRSMTGFARCDEELETGTLVWELRTINHRYLELVFRLPEEFRAAEPRFRTLLSASIKRGKFSCITLKAQ